MAGFLLEFRERRVLPAVGVYAGSCWVLIEILDRLVERYLLSPYITDIAFWGLYSLIPAVVLIAWTHGKPGKDEITTAEKVGIPINLIATTGLLISVFGGKELGATADLVIVENEQGIQETHVVPNDSFRRRMVVFFFESADPDPQDSWLQYAVTDLLVQGLTQSPFVSATSPWTNMRNGYYARMLQAGFKDAIGVPRSLMREIASDANRQHFVEGSISRVAEEYVITARLWETESLQLQAEISESGWDLYSAVDAMSARLFKALDVPLGSGAMARMPLSETYGETTEAFRKYILALNTRLFENDLQRSLDLLEESLKEDPDFVQSWLLKATSEVEAADLPGAMEAVQKAKGLDYRLPDNDRALVKQLDYRLSGQQDKLIAFLQMQVRLRDDAGSYNTLASMLMATGQLEQARDAFKQSLDREPLNTGIHLQLATLSKGLGDSDAAIGHVRDYLDEKPDDADAQIRMGDLLRDIGDLDGAEAHYMQASMLDNEPVGATLKLALIALRKGDEISARGLIEEAEEIATTPQSKAQVRAVAVFLEGRVGRIHSALEQLERQGEYLAEVLPPFQVGMQIFSTAVALRLQLGDTGGARQALDEAREVVKPPLDRFLSLSHARILLAEGRHEEAERELANVNDIIDEFKLEEMKSGVDIVLGKIRYERGDYPGSAQALKSASDRIRASVLVGSDGNLLLPPVYADLVRAYVQAGMLEEAEDILNEAFEQDPSEPRLWLSKAIFQRASGMPQLALASANYALAIWKEADPDFIEFRLARQLAQEIQSSP